MEGFLFQAMIYLTAMVVAVPIVARLGLGSVLGYLLAGVVIGPALGLVGSETKDLQHFAEFGVVMMLFLIGLELEPRALWAMRQKLLGLGGLQVTVTTALIAGAGMALGHDWKVSLAVGMIFALSSTAIVLQTLTEKGLMQTSGGRGAFSVLLTQDLAVIPMLAVMPLLASAAIPADHGEDAAHGGHGIMDTDASTAVFSFIDTLPGWGVTLLTLGSIVSIVLAGIYLTRPAFSFIHGSRMREMYTAFALFIVITIACLMLMVDLSPALGTFLAGVVLANSEFRHELESDLEPFKGLLLGLFFITVGAGIDFNIFFGEPGLVLGLTLAVVLIKGAVLFLLALIFRIKGRDRWLFTLGLAQAGEFGFVLIGFATQQSVLGGELSQTLYLVVALSMLLTPLLFILYEFIAKRLRESDPAMTPDVITERGPIIIAGVGRFGQVVNRMIQMSGFKAIVLDHDLNTIRLMRSFGFKGFLGDPTRPELLKAAGIEEASVLVAAMDEKDATTRIVRHARSIRPDLHIVARARDRVHVYELYQAGANDIVREMFDSSLRAARYVLENMGVSEFEAAKLEKTFFQMDRHAVRELAEFWNPSIPVGQNKAYIERSKELNKELEAALVSQLVTAQEQEEKLDTDRETAPRSRRVSFQHKA
ncbi:monovalent cation:proton antiporter-2 (CPA2) family protein [Qingshengfaniella alkalisoli]|uniref:Potassium transporter n=1 Tax=Qingshengfaniella alkalisoli TaxID=2599296 RepID=A0A5B8I6X5_9RHOB|nr:monovalent cation:proton antiporter-2 (CPA2) family protein [Qingshengfaniella alkalisoli]QDY69259.1 potassium transporter [Qingshengfaniella alkalisoli]